MCLSYNKFDVIKGLTIGQLPYTGGYNYRFKRTYAQGLIQLNCFFDIIDNYSHVMNLRKWRPPRFCSTKCRMRAYRKRKAEARWNEWVAERMRLREEAEREYQRQSKDAQQ